MQQRLWAEARLNRDSVFATLLPAGVAVFEAVGFDDWDCGLEPEEERLTRYFVPKRRREFAAGRNCARAALQSLGCTPQPIGIGPAREPLFPAGVSGTITHIGDYCAAAAVRRGEVVSVGIDADVAEPLEAESADLVLRPEEQCSLASQAAACPFPDKLVFSIKEAFFKAYFQCTNRYLDFLEANVQLQPACRAFTISIVHCDVDPYFRGRTFSGFYAQDQHRVYSAVALPRA